MRIAYLCEHSTLLGGERSLTTFLAHAVRLGIEPFVVCPSEGRLVEAVAAAGWAHLPWPGEPKSSHSAAADLLSAAGIDLVHANSLSLLDAASALRQLLDKPAIVHVRDVYGLSLARRNRLASLDGVIAVSHAVGRWLRDQGAPEDRLHVIANAVEMRRAADPNESASRASLGLPTGKRLVAVIGQICLRKGQDTFLAAASTIAGARSDVDFLLIGERYSAKEESRAFEARLKEMGSRPPLAGRVHWLGYRDDVERLLPHLDVVVVASRQEPLSRVLLESLAAGVPVVATDVGGSGEILDEGRMGRLVPVDDVASMARAIQETLDDETGRARLKIQGPEHIRRHYGPEKQAAEILAIYRALGAR